jgi:hypothetical protein
MTASIDTDQSAALPLIALRACQDGLRSAALSATLAAAHLAGARKTRAIELSELVADAIMFCERLSTIALGDYRADQAAGPC